MSVVTSSQRYTAKQAYQLWFMRGLANSKQVGFHCVVKPSDGLVELWNETGLINTVRIAKAWRELI